MKKSKILVLTILAATLMCCFVLGACVVTEPSLSVTFDKTHTVYVGDDLDSLKPYLTVTFTSGDGSTTTLEPFDYALLGELTEGECTITVAYRQHQATFSVAVQPFPDKGTRLNPYTLDEAYFEAPKLGENGYSAQPVYVRARVEMAEHSGNDWVILLKESDKQYSIMVNYATLADGILSVERDDLVLVCGYLHFIDGNYGNPPQLVSREDTPCTVLERFAVGTLQNPYSVSLARNLARELADNTYSQTPVYVQGRISGDVTQGNPGYRFDITDGYEEITVYYALLGENVDTLGKGDLVTIYGYMYNYYGDYQHVYEMKSGNGVDVTVTECVHPIVSKITLSVDKTVLENEDVATFTVTTVPVGHENEVNFLVDGTGRFAGDIVGNKFVPDANFDCEVAVYAELDGIMSDYVYINVWGGGKTSFSPLSVMQVADRASQMNDTYSKQACYVKGIVASELNTAINGYTFDICDEIYSDVTLTVVNAVFDGTVNERDVKLGDVVTVSGYIYQNGDLCLRTPNGGSCTVAQWTPQNGISLTLSADKTQLKTGETATLYVSVGGYSTSDPSDVTFEVTYGNNVGHTENNLFVADDAGECGVRAVLESEGKTYYSNEITFSVAGEITEEVTILLKADRYLIEYSDNTFVYATVEPASYASQLIFEITDGREVASLVGNAQAMRSVLPMDEGYVTVTASVGQYRSNPVTIQIVRYDPYANVGASGFYDRYTPAKDLEDSYWRTKHNLMSGSIAEQNQSPTIAANRPKEGNKFVRNTDENFFDNGNSYKVVDYNGNVVNTIYKCGAYVTLEEVAAYVYAWGNVPANYTTDKSGNPRTNAWGKFLRLNNSYFSGDTSEYPYEPVLPNINGAGGSLYYYEIDIGTTGTDCDPGFPCKLYNDGSKITRGAARIVYARYDGNNNLLSPTDRYVFYTYNHYNDFQEYLNYKGGWGEMFGNITGGGQISSDHYYNPTPYVPTARGSFGCR